jgi:tRNA U55 pseudouridine synthase TruB
VASWTIDDASTLEVMLGSDEPGLKAKLLAVDAMLDSLTTVKIDAVQQNLFSNGGRVRIEALNAPAQTDKTVRVYVEEKFLGVAELKNGVLHPIRLIGKE